MNSLGSKTEPLFVPLLLTASMFAVQNLGLPMLSLKHLLTSMFTTGISWFNATAESPAPKGQ